MAGFGGDEVEVVIVGSGVGDGGVAADARGKVASSEGVDVAEGVMAGVKDDSDNDSTSSTCRPSSRLVGSPLTNSSSRPRYRSYISSAAYATTSSRKVRTETGIGLASGAGASVGAVGTGGIGRGNVRGEGWREVMEDRCTERMLGSGEEISRSCCQRNVRVS